MTNQEKAKKKVRFIVNAFSGTSSKSDFVQKVEKHLDHKQFEYDIHYTEYASHGTLLSKEAVDQNYDIVVAAGGDGTVNEIAKVLVNTSVVLGIIPGGSGNGFAMHLGMGRNAVRAIKILNSAETISIDTCKINDHFFINVAGAGFDAWVAYQKKKSNKRGFAMYVSGVLKESMSYKAQEYEVTVDGKKMDGKYLTIAVANATMYGYNFTIAPKAELRDGLFDLIMIKDAPKWRQFLASTRFLNRTIHKSNLCVFTKAKTVEVRCKDKIPYHFDGEGFYDNGPLSFRLEPLSLKVLIPREKVIS